MVCRMRPLEPRCALIRMLDGAYRSITDVREEKANLPFDLAIRAVAEDEADVIVMAGAGLATLVSDRIPVPVVDCIQAAVKQADTQVPPAPAPPAGGGFRRPGAKPSRGLDPTLAARIAQTDDQSAGVFEPRGEARSGGRSPPQRPDQAAPALSATAISSHPCAVTVSASPPCRITVVVSASISAGPLIA